MFREKTGEACGYTFTSNNRANKQPLIKTEIMEKKHLKVNHAFMQ